MKQDSRRPDECSLVSGVRTNRGVLKFVAELLDGEKMAVLCRRFGVSPKTGYKMLERYNSCGLEGLTDHSRRP